MKKSKILSSALALALTVGPLSMSAKASVTDYLNDSAKAQFSTGAPVDFGIANDEKLIEMLKKQGKIASDATPAEAEKTLTAYLHEKAQAAASSQSEKGELAKQEAKIQDQTSEKLKEQGLLNGKGNKFGHTKGSNLDTVQPEAYDGQVRTDKVLVLLVDYPDKKHGTIKEGSTDMYYSDYSKQHYQDMIFGKDGYKGPNGENLVSMKQYYEAQSGGSYSVEGEVAGWYTASQPAAYYGGNISGSDGHPRTLIYEALKAAAKDPSVNLADYDQWDRYDLDGDGVLNEPDGLIDHLMVIHSGIGEEAGGGELGADAIWSHRWNLGGVATIPGTEGQAQVPYWGGALGAYDYTVEPEDGAAGVMSHEFGHDLGLPDEYDTQYSGAGEAVSYWSIMASGSWAGAIPGTEPSGFSAYAKEYLQAAHGGNWQSGTTINATDVTSKGTEVLLDEASTKGTNNDAVRINLPDKETVINTPYSGSYEYFSGSGNDLNNSMSTTLDLTNASSATLNFKTWYSIEEDWDYAFVKVNGETVKGNITRTTNPHGNNEGFGITGDSNGWVDASFDLSQYAGQQVTVELAYKTDAAAALPGFYVDDVAINVDGSQVLFDDAEGTPQFDLAGFTKDQGKFYSKHYYLLEWRSHNGVDEGLAHIARGDSLMSFDSGLVVWYVDDSYDNNWVGYHPGDGFLGVVDADQRMERWSDGEVGSSRYQLHDAAFNTTKSSDMFLDYSNYYGITMTDNVTQAQPIFDDSTSYTSSVVGDFGRNVPTFGLKFRVVDQSADGTVAKVQVYK